MAKKKRKKKQKKGQRKKPCIKRKEKKNEKKRKKEKAMNKYDSVILVFHCSVVLLIYVDSTIKRDKCCP